LKSNTVDGDDDDDDDGNENGNDDDDDNHGQSKLTTRKYLKVGRFKTPPKTP